MTRERLTTISNGLMGLFPSCAVTGFPLSCLCLLNWRRGCLGPCGVTCPLQGCEPHQRWICPSHTCLSLGQPETQWWMWKSFLGTSLLCIGPLSDLQRFPVPKVFVTPVVVTSSPAMCCVDSLPAPVPRLLGSETEEP